MKLALIATVDMPFILKDDTNQPPTGKYNAHGVQPPTGKYTAHGVQPPTGKYIAHGVQQWDALQGIFRQVELF